MYYPLTALEHHLSNQIRDRLTEELFNLLHEPTGRWNHDGITLLVHLLNIAESEFRVQFKNGERYTMAITDMIANKFNKDLVSICADASTFITLYNFPTNGEPATRKDCYEMIDRLLY